MIVPTEKLVTKLGEIGKPVPTTSEALKYIRDQFLTEAGIRREKLWLEKYASVRELLTAGKATLTRNGDGLTINLPKNRSHPFSS